MTFHLHIKGRVQGVGFRPFVIKFARQKNIRGYVSNDSDGLHIIFNQTSAKDAGDFAGGIIAEAPSKAIIHSWDLEEIQDEIFEEFSIHIQKINAAPALLISPDFALCEECRQEFHDPGNRRFQYAFITCTVCGPRFSIMKQLPYERHLTSMEKFSQCVDCNREYQDINDRRYFSQTNSCSTCGIQLSWHQKNNEDVLKDQEKIGKELIQAFKNGKIVAVKGIGGYLLMCDAANDVAIKMLRERKHRPLKPFAVLFCDTEVAGKFIFLLPEARNVLLSEVAPIVLLQAKDESFRLLDMQGIAPGLTSLGVMIPYAPLLEWISFLYEKPLIATSGNLNGSCIIFQSERKKELFEFADFILDHNREIVIPEDDSVIRFAEKSSQQIILRRSRGLAPALILKSELKNSETIFAAGASLKSAFAIQHNHQIYLSQFLGNLESYDAQQNYLYTLHHFEKLLQTKPQVIICDLHPEYASTKIAEELSVQGDLSLKKIQHHEAHFTAVLGEHDLFDSGELTLGVIWDGAGLGTDGNIWGGEFFIYEGRAINRIHYLEPFNSISGDKIAREPRLAALSIANNIKGSSGILQQKFSEQEWNFYEKAMKHSRLKNSSAGRYFDAVASLLDLININSFEGEAALLLEQIASDYFRSHDFKISNHYFNEKIDQPTIPMQSIIGQIVDDLKGGITNAEIAARFHQTLVEIIHNVARKAEVKNIAFSGGVFQNSVLVDLLHLQLGKTFQLCFHRQMPPNDECIAFGQLMHYENIKE